MYRLPLIVCTLCLALAACRAEEPLIERILDHHRDRSIVVGQLVDQVGTETEPDSGQLFHHRFWIQAPSSFHIHEQKPNQPNDWQKYISNGTTFWEVVHSFGDEIIDKKDATEIGGIIVEVPRLLRLDPEDLAKDFVLMADDNVERSAPAWQAAHRVHLEPRSPELRSQFRWIEMHLAADLELAGIRLLDAQDNLRTITIKDIDYPDSLPDGMFAWAGE